MVYEVTLPNNFACRQKKIDRLFKPVINQRARMKKPELDLSSGHLPIIR
ncbi:hypothetical protein [Ochrobactrum teleogrylli]|uniref:Transposase n=1 Tax=Ochrobactrum teleogrylli TaxID=2479765 RepID=A0ABD5JYK9_9HYPH